MDFSLLISIIGTFLVTAILVLTFLEKFEKLIVRIYKFLGFINRTYVKYDLQSKINDYLKKVSKKVKHLDIKKIKIKWVDAKNQTEKEYLQDGKMTIRLKKGDYQNENIIRASMAFISYAFLKKAKSHIAKYQRDSLDLYACYDLLNTEKSELKDQFVQDFMKDKMEDDKISDFFEKCSYINDVGIFYPVLVQELTFLGEKVFAKKREKQKIYEEVTRLVSFLYQYANRKLGEEKNANDFTGAYCKFGIRIIGKSYKIGTEGESVYIKHLKEISTKNETLYLIGDEKHKYFMNTVFKGCKSQIDYYLLSDETYKATIKDRDDNDLKVKSYIMTIRSNSIKVYHKK